MLKCLLNIAKPILQSGAENIKTALPLPSERNHFHNRTPPRQQSPNKQRSGQDSEACCWTCSQHVTHMHTLWEKPVRWIRKQTGRQLSCCWWQGYRSVCEDRALHMYFDFTFGLMLWCVMWQQGTHCSLFVLKFTSRVVSSFKKKSSHKHVTFISRVL